MSNSGKPERLDRIEIKLTPKEWAIRLADEKRRHSSAADFLKAIAKGTYRESPYSKPFYGLAQQAEERHSGPNPAESRARVRLNQKLRQEFHSLKLLITNIDETIRDKAETNRLRASALAIQLNQLILQDAFVQTSEKAAAFIGRCDVTDGGEQEERQLILKELAECVAAGLHPCSPSLAQDWADGSAMFLMEMLAYKAAFRLVEGKYFDGHSILIRDVERALETTIELILDAVAIFNQYVDMRLTSFRQDSDRTEPSDERIQPDVPNEQQTRALSVDVESIRGRANEWIVDAIVAEWVIAAKNKAVGDILRETGEHEAFVWKRFREEVGGEDHREESSGFLA